MASYYPIFLNIGGRRCVVVGGGQVALRKVNTLLELGAAVKVISGKLCAELEALAAKGKIEVIRRNYQTGDLAEAFVATAATDDNKVNIKVSRDAREDAVLVNVVDDAELSDFIVPSCLRRGDVTIAVSTGGKSPALARRIRTGLEGYIGEEYAALVDLVEEVRSEAKRRRVKIEAEDWQKALDLKQLTRFLRSGERQKARDLLLDNLKIVSKS